MKTIDILIKPDGTITVDSEGHDCKDVKALVEAALGGDTVTEYTEPRHRPMQQTAKAQIRGRS
jgi:hypothetical protein